MTTTQKKKKVSLFLVGELKKFDVYVDSFMAMLNVHVQIRQTNRCNGKQVRSRLQE